MDGECGAARILVVDDDAAIGQLIRRLLEQNGHSADVVLSGEDALKRDHTEYGALVVDKNLPGIDGIEIIREVRRTTKTIGIVVVTGYPTAESTAAAVNLGVDSCLEKPFKGRELIASVELALANARRRADTAQNLASAKLLARSVRGPKTS